MAINTHCGMKNSIQQKVIDDKIREELGLADFVAEDDICNDSYYDSADVIYVKDFGAKGDGIKNDSSAIRKALTALKHLPKGSTLIFEPDTTYYISSGKYAVDLKDLDGVNICGNNTTILVKPIMSICRIENCSDVVIKGLTFDYRIKPFVAADVISASDDGIIRIRTDKSLNIRGTYKQPVADYFGLVDRNDSRYPIGITTYKVVNSGENVYDVKCNNIFENRDSRIKMMKEERYRFIVPMPHVGQVIEQAISITGNKNITMLDCNVSCAAKFMFFISGNEGFVYLKNLNVGPGEENKTEIPMIGWKDGFCCKDNRGTIVWENCNVKSLCDDVLNMTSSQLQVQMLEDDLVSLYFQETALPYADVKVGDEITFFDSETDKVLGTRKIISAEKFDSHVEVKLDSEMKELFGLSAIGAFINGICSVNSVIKNCDFRGNFKLHTPLYVKQSKLLIKGINTEQKVPSANMNAKNILFSDCQIEFDAANVTTADFKLPKETVFFECEIKKKT